MKSQLQKRASAYMFAVVILAALTLLGVFFVKSQILNRRSAYYSHNKRQAVMIAQAALDYAAAEIPHIAMRCAYDDPTASYQFRDDLDTNIEDTHFPSFYISDHPYLEFGYSYDRRDSNPSLDHTQYATLKIIDANALFNVNSPILNSVDPRDNKIWRNVLTTVCQFSTSKANQVIDKIEEYRRNNNVSPNPLYQYHDIRELSHLVYPDNVLTKEQFATLENYLTVHSWGNPNSITYNSTYDFTLSNVHVETRYPINMNVTSPNMLKAVLLGITATSQFEGKTEIDSTAANRVAYSIVANRPIKTWNQFEELLQKLAKDYPSELSEAQADAIFAAVYPGVRLNNQDPDKFHLRKFDKFDIKDDTGHACGTTEFCLFSPGVFYMQALGRVVQNQNDDLCDIVATAKLTANVKLWEPTVINTQREFDRLRLTTTKYDAWTSNLARLPFDEVNPTVMRAPVADNQYFGNVFECNPESVTPCLYWDNDSSFEKRPDGLYLKGTNPRLFQTDPDPYWKNDGFDLWIKPGYESTNSIKIAEKHEYDTSATTKCYIRTRLAYENGYITLSRTYGINAGLSRPDRELPTRMFYGVTPYLDTKTKLEGAGNTFYSLIVMALNKEYHKQDINISIVRQDQTNEIPQFKERVYRGVYGSFCSGHSSVETVQTYCMVIAQKEELKPDGSLNIQRKEVRINVNIPVKANWLNITACPAESIFGKAPVTLTINIYKELWKYVFTAEPQIKTVERSADQIEARDINNFPAPNPVHSTHVYSRTEHRATMTLEKGYWYHITGRWDDLLVKELTIHYWDAVNSTIVKVTGEMQWNLAEGPLHLWPLKGTVEVGLRYYAPKCTIYHSPYRKPPYNNPDSKVWRYWPQQSMSDTYASNVSDSSAITGVFDLHNISMINPSNLTPDKARLCRFGVVGWTCYTPLKKGEPKLSIELRSDLGTPPSPPNGAIFKQDGEQNAGPTLSSLYFSPIHRYVYPTNDTGANNRVLFNLFLVDDLAQAEAQRNTYETIIVDQIWLYLLLHPQYFSIKES